MSSPLINSVNVERCGLMLPHDIQGKTNPQHAAKAFFSGVHVGMREVSGHRWCPSVGNPGEHSDHMRKKAMATSDVSRY